MKMKTCFKCKETKTTDDFYKHKRMLDGLLGKCKQCAKTDSTRHRNNNIEEVRAYDRARGGRRTAEDLQIYRKATPIANRAHALVGSALKRGSLDRMPCEICGNPQVHAHHDDYAMPLNVRWLCPMHHHQWHRDNGEAANKYADIKIQVLK